ncbi:MAG: RcnB family protein [Sphingomicrobium sp.]
MRNSLLFLLLVSSAVPALAADPDDGDRAARREARAERAEARAERQAEQAQPAERSEPRVQVRSVEPRHDDRPDMHQQQFDVVHGRAVQAPSQPALDTAPGRPAMEVHREPSDSVRDWRARERQVGGAPADIERHNRLNNGSFREVRQERIGRDAIGDSPVNVERHNGTLGNGSFREMRRERAGRDGIGNRRGPMIGSIPRPGTPPPLPTSTRQSRTGRLSSVTAQHWRNNWRSDHRYDWHNHRHHHRSLFHLGFYYDPFGWGYRHYSIGSRLWPSYYRSGFWLNDPWQYRLPYAPPGYRWIRYYEDAVLVDTWDGQVVDVIYNFFW